MTHSIVSRSVLFTLVFLAAGLLFSTSATHAYFTTDQQAVAVGDTGIFTIEFRFGHQDNDVHIPVSATFASGHVSSTTLSYAITDRFGNSGAGTAAGMVLSGAPIENGMYVVPKGSAATFTLLMLYTPEETAVRNKYRAKVTHLPFRFDDREQLALNPSELEYYETGELTLK